MLGGVHAVEEALRARAGDVRRVALVEGALAPTLKRLLELAQRAGVSVERRPKATLDRVAGGARHQGVVAWIEMPRALTLRELLQRQPAPSLVVALDQVTDTGNLAAALRSAAVFGAEAVIVPQRGAAGPAAVLYRRSAGAAGHVELVREVNLARALRQLREAGLWVVGLEAGAAPLWEAFDLTRPVALVLGAEGRGLRRLTREGCDVLAGIPATGALGTLNVAVACGVALYEVSRQRSQRGIAGGD